MPVRLGAGGISEINRVPVLYNRVFQAGELLSVPSCACRSSGRPLEGYRLEYLKIVALGKFISCYRTSDVRGRKKIVSFTSQPLPSISLLPSRPCPLAVRSLSAAGSGPGLEGTCRNRSELSFFFIYSNYRASAPASGMQSCRLITYYLDLVNFCFLEQLLVPLQW